MSPSSWMWRVLWLLWTIEDSRGNTVTLHLLQGPGLKNLAVSHPLKQSLWKPWATMLEVWPLWGPPTREATSSPVLSLSWAHSSNYSVVSVLPSWMLQTNHAPVKYYWATGTEEHWLSPAWIPHLPNNQLQLNGCCFKLLLPSLDDITGSSLPCSSQWIFSGWGARLHGNMNLLSLIK
jgi:hypothetical protein